MEGLTGTDAMTVKMTPKYLLYTSGSETIYFFRWTETQHPLYTIGSHLCNPAYINLTMSGFEAVIDTIYRICSCFCFYFIRRNTHTRTHTHLHTHHNSSSADLGSCWLWGRLLSLLGEASFCPPVGSPSAAEDDNEEEDDKDSRSPSIINRICKSSWSPQTSCSSYSLPGACGGK